MGYKKHLHVVHLNFRLKIYWFIYLYAELFLKEDFSSVKVASTIGAS